MIMRWRTLILYLLATCVCASAQDIYSRFTGSCQQGGSVLVTNGQNSASPVQISYPACTITVYVHGTINLASLFSDAQGQFPLANPFSAASTGTFGFYAANGRYDVNLSGGGIIVPFTITDVPLCFNCYLGANGQFVSSTSTQGYQAIPPAFPYVIWAADTTGTCAYPLSILANGQAMLCNPGSGALLFSNGGGFTQLFTVRWPGNFTDGSIPQYVFARGRFEVSPLTVSLSQLSAQAADTLVMNASGSSASPTAVAAPTGGTNGCSGATNSVTYNNSTHSWGCNTVTPVTSFILNNFCTGQVGGTNGGTYVLEPGSTGTACTTTGVAEIPIPATCSMQKMYVTASAAGGAAGSGATTLFKNGSGTALTCTLGTGTTCNDTTHTVSFNAGDTWSMRTVTAQASDTTANIKVALLCQ
jgi:hypothetical protein